MKKLIYFAFVITSCILISCSENNEKVPPENSAEYLFTDDFEKGNLTHTENGVIYKSSTSTEVSSKMKKKGTYSLKFLFKGAISGEDSFSEQRISYPNTEELWIKYDLYIPNNYYHRKETGPSNNKFLAIYKNKYTNPGFQVNWSLSPNNTGGSNLSLHRYRNGSEQSTIAPTEKIGDDFITTNDHGKWVKITARVKTPSNSTAADGVMQMWKNGVLVCNETQLNMFGGDSENYMNELYLLGWSNSGFLENTLFYIDDLSLNFSSF